MHTIIVVRSNFIGGSGVPLPRYYLIIIITIIIIIIIIASRVIFIITLIKIFFVDGHAKDVGQYDPKDRSLAWSKTIPVRFPGKPIQQKALYRINVHAAFRELDHWVQNT